MFIICLLLLGKHFLFVNIKQQYTFFRIGKKNKARYIDSVTRNVFKSGPQTCQIGLINRCVDIFLSFQCKATKKSVKVEIFS
jgi:hypothetical protein